MGMKLQTMYKRKRLPKIKINLVELQHFAQTPEVPQYWHDLYWPANQTVSRRAKVLA